MTETLVALAERFVTLTSELNATREAMRRLLMNGADPDPDPPVNPMSAKRPGGKRSHSPPSNRKAARARQGEQAILDLLKMTPGMRTSELAKQTEAQMSTVSERLRRMKRRGQVASEGEGWRAAG